MNVFGYRVVRRLLRYNFVLVKISIMVKSVSYVVQYSPNAKLQANIIIVEPTTTVFKQQWNTRLANQSGHELSSIRMLMDIFFLNMKQFTTECSRGRQKMYGPTAVYISKQNNGTIIVPLDLALGTKSIF